MVLHYLAKQETWKLLSLHLSIQHKLLLSKANKHMLQNFKKHRLLLVLAMMRSLPSTK